MSELHRSFEHLASDLRAAANPERAPQMAAYLKDQFPVLGVSSPERRTLQKPFMTAARTAAPDDVLDVADLCWHADEREFQHVGADLLRVRAKTFQAADLDRLHTFIVHKSWWDTVDALAAHPVGTLVMRYPELGAVMDRWIDDDNIWVARTAILQQLRYKDAINEARLFSYVEKRAADIEFFIRKALGWALRDYARVAPDAVRDFVNSHQEALSGLTKREALKHL